MNIEKMLEDRSGSKCELCGATSALQVYAVPPIKDETIDEHAMLCGTCHTQVEDPEQADANHWRCLNESMWSEVPAIQVLAWRMLNQLNTEGWAQDLLDMLYIDDETLKWAKSLAAKVVHKDSNGAILQAGDTVTLIKDLNVKGVSFIAKRGTAVRRITLVSDNPEHIEGKVNDQRIVILTQYVKKTK